MASQVTVIRKIVAPLGLSRWLPTILRFARRKPLGTFGAIVILGLLFMGTFADEVAPYRFDDFNIPERLQSPSMRHPFGTDNQGRDVLSRVIYGARTTVFVGFGAVTVTMLVAVTLGIVSDYFGGLLDLLVQRLVDIWQAFPGLIFVIFVVSITGPGVPTLIFTIGLLFVVGCSRVIRSATLAIKENPYVEAARIIGYGDLRIIRRQILPNVMPIILVVASIYIGSAILLESSLSFLGYGTPPPFPSWGRMLQEAQREIVNYPYLAIFPGAAIALTVYSFNMFGDALRDVMDPRLRGSR